MTSRFRPEPAHDHATRERTAVVWCNLGTPDEPTPAAVRRYLAEFLWDARVVEIPRAVWWLILHGIILRTRPAKSAAKYRSVWTAQGSPLRVHTDAQAALLQAELQRAGHDVTVVNAMRYGQPSLSAQLDRLKASGHTRVLFVPAYPQYSGTTTASVTDAVFAWGQTVRNLPELRFVRHYHDDPGYIAALARTVRDHWDAHGRADHLLMSFHGVPERTLHLGDPYHCECHKTARLLATELGLAEGTWSLSFQSRLGRAKWLEPYTEPTLIALAQRGVGRVDVVCPGFTADCLETLEEIDMEGRAAFLGAGGQAFHYIPCLNETALWLSALAQIVQRHLGGWDSPQAAGGPETAERAKALGAAR